jgi:hypothetical protein
VAAVVAAAVFPDLADGDRHERRLPSAEQDPAIDRMSPRLAAKAAGLVHDLHRIRLPFSRRAVLPLNRRVIASHLVELRETFAEHGVTFWLRDGSALGAYRERGIVPHDDDIDIGVWWADLTGVQRVVAALERRGFVTYRRVDGQFALFKNWETVEICVSGWPGEKPAYSAKLEEFFSELQPIELWGGNFLIPLRIESYLEFCYGPDWRVPKFAPWSNSCWQPPADRDRHAREFQPKTAP